MSSEGNIAPNFDHLDPQNALMPLMMLLTSYNVDGSTNGVIQQRSWCCTSFQLSWHKEWSCVIDNTFGIMWHKDQYQWYQWLKKWCCTSFQWAWPKEFIGAIFLPFASCDANKSANVAHHIDYLDYTNAAVLWMRALASHEQKSNVACHFDHLDLENGMVPLWASCDIHTHINCITWPKKLYWISFWLSWLNKCSGAIDDAIGITWYWWQWHHMKKMLCFTFFSSS